MTFLVGLVHVVTQQFHSQVRARETLLLTAVQCSRVETSCDKVDAFYKLLKYTYKLKDRKMNTKVRMVCVCGGVFSG